MSLMKTLLAGAALTAITAGSALADPALIFDLGGKFDKSFNEAGFMGAQRWVEETGGSYQRAGDAVRGAARAGAAAAGRKRLEPDRHDRLCLWRRAEPGRGRLSRTRSFAIIDMVVEQPNVKSVVFTEEEGSYLAGIMAAMASKIGTVGFIGGMDIPLIRKFGCGFAQGVQGGAARGGRFW